MKHFKRFFILILCVLPWVAGANVATTAGSNLTAWNGNSGSTNNNTWNTMMNSRAQPGGKAKADFGNCNSLILRCAQPKCAACTKMELARPVVAGCVNSSKDCKKHGDDLIEFIAAQIVANAAEKAQAQELALKQAEAQAAAAQSSRQIEEMQQQMAQMQRDMKSQNAQQMEKMQAALDEQKALNAKAAEQAAAKAKQEAEAAQKVSGVTAAQQAAIDKGVSDDEIVREQVGGEILTAVEAAEKQLVELKAAMKDIFDYAHCDSRGGNCAGPKRVKIFKDKAMKFFDPYEAIADEMYEALEIALAVGVDVSDVLMMLSGACNRWGKYMCTGDGKNEHVPVTYKGGEGETAYSDCGYNGKSEKGTYSRGGHECSDTQIIPPQDDKRCTLIGFISENDNSGDGVRREWLSESYDGDKFIRVGCASSVLDTMSIFANRKNKKGSVLNIDVLERIIEQDSYEYSFSAYGDDDTIRRVRYCALTEQGYQDLVAATAGGSTSSLGICKPDYLLDREVRYANLSKAFGYQTRELKKEIPKVNDTCSGFTLDYGCDDPDVVGSNCKIKDTSQGCYFYNEAYVALAKPGREACEIMKNKWIVDKGCKCLQKVGCCSDWDGKTEVVKKECCIDADGSDCKDDE